MVEFWADLGVTSFKVYVNVTREDLKEVLKKAHERNCKVTGHIGAVTHREAANMGIDCLEHGFWVSTDFVRDKLPDICPSWERRSSSLLALDADDPEMEDLIRKHPDVEGVAVVGMPDPKMGERACAYVVPSPGKGFSFEEMIEFLKGQGASVLLLPERLEIVDSLPLTGMGKVDKKALRKDIGSKLG